jgi:phage shock protein PspC (stress-responsive transcriptional regulator)
MEYIQTKKDKTTMAQKKFFLSSTDKKIAGVCGGIAEYFEIDSLLVRVAFLVLFFGFGTGLLAYLVLWLLAPKSNDIII